MKKLTAAVTAFLLLLALASCAGTPAPAPTPEPTPTPAPQEKTAADMTVEELRQKLAGAAGAEAEELYRELLARDAFTQEDYEALIALYEQSGRQAEQRELLRRLLILYPSQETADRLSALTADRSDSAVCAALAEQALALMEAGQVQELRELVFSDAWNAAFQDRLRAVEIRSRVETEAGLLLVRALWQSAELRWLDGEGNFLYFLAEPEGSALASATVARGAYNGPALSQRYDPEGNLLVSYAATLADNVCAGTLAVSAGGVDYTGALTDQGGAAEPQEASAPGVVYAHSGARYLYVENETVESFRADSAFLGLPVYEEW